MSDVTAEQALPELRKVENPMEHGGWGLLRKQPSEEVASAHVWRPKSGPPPDYHGEKLKGETREKSRSRPRDSDYQRRRKTAVLEKARTSLPPLEEPLEEPPSLTPFTEATREKIMRVNQWKLDHLDPKSPLFRLRKELRERKAERHQSNAPADYVVGRSSDRDGASSTPDGQTPVTDMLFEKELKSVPNPAKSRDSEDRIDLHVAVRAARKEFEASCEGKPARGLQRPGEAVSKVDLLRIVTSTAHQSLFAYKPEFPQKPTLSEDQVASEYLRLKWREAEDESRLNNILRDKLFRLDQRAAATVHPTQSRLLDVSDEVLVASRPKYLSPEEREAAAYPEQTFRRAMRGLEPAAHDARLLVKPSHSLDITEASLDLMDLFNRIQRLDQLLPTFNYALAHHDGPFFLGWWVADAIDRLYNKSVSMSDQELCRVVFSMIYSSRAASVKLSMTLLVTCWRIVMKAGSLAAVRTMLELTEGTGFEQLGKSFVEYLAIKFRELTCASSPDDYWQYAVRPGSRRMWQTPELGPRAWMEHDKYELLTGWRYSGVPDDGGHQSNNLYSRLKNRHVWGNTNYSRALTHAFQTHLKALDPAQASSIDTAVSLVANKYFRLLLKSGDWDQALDLLRKYPRGLARGGTTLTEILLILKNQCSQAGSMQELRMAHHRLNPMTGSMLSDQWRILLDRIVGICALDPLARRALSRRSPSSSLSASGKFQTGTALVRTWADGIGELLNMEDEAWVTRVEDLLRSDNDQFGGEGVSLEKQTVLAGG